VVEVEGCSGTPGGGRYIVLRLQIADATIQDCSFETNGCPHAHKAVGGMVAFLKNRKVEQASRLESDDLLVLIGGLPDGKGYYASMAVEALQEALSKSNAATAREFNTAYLP
jgi:NifU-like protein involved in Fe-S cluster formation